MPARDVLLIPDSVTVRTGTTGSLSFYREDGTRVPGISTILKHEHLVDYGALEDMPTGDREYYMQRGKYVDAATELIDAGTLNWGTLDPRLAPYLEGYARFRQDTRLEVVATQERVVHPEALYNGIVDRRYRTTSGSLLIVDIKLTQHRRGDFLQVAGYDTCYPFRHDIYVLVLTKDGNYKLVPSITPNADRLTMESAGRIYYHRQREGLA